MKSVTIFIFLGLFCVVLHAADLAIDFSYAGFGGGGLEIPAVQTKIAVTPTSGDDTKKIQTAIDNISGLTADFKGFRGAVVLSPGVYHVDGQIKIQTSGVVLRGEKATIIATGQSRRALILISNGTTGRELGRVLTIAKDAPAGCTQLALRTVEGLNVGSRVVIRRPSSKEWIHDLGMDQFAGSFNEIRLNWLPGSRDVEWERTIRSIDATSNTITFDAPITLTLEERYGGATVQVLGQACRLRYIGIENLMLCSEFDSTNLLDEEHSWIGIQIDNTEDAWVRDISACNFVSAVLWLSTNTKAITVQDCISEHSVGEDAGWRKFGFYVGGQQILVQRCVADHARQPFLAGLRSAGPNVFLECSAEHVTGDSGSIESWATGALFDHVKIDGGSLTLGNLGARWQGTGWNTANCIIWNCSAKNIVAENPPGATNLNHSDTASTSLYRTQLTARLGAKALTALNPKGPKPTIGDPNPSTTPLTAAPRSNPDLRPPPSDLNSLAPLTVSGGRFVFGGKALFGIATSNAWWKGQTIPSRAAELGWSVTRWAPGRTGPGLTEDLSELASRLAASGSSLVQVWPGLWYDRRRDAHVTEPQADSEVWAPFYEQPWARSGKGRATDGLSKFDLTKFNPWYWKRLHDFASECASRGMVLYHHFYNHHNLVEVPPHWADFVWRPINCLQTTGFPEPPSYELAGGNSKRVYMVAQFYDVSNPVRSELHRLYIWHGLDALADQPNVIHTLAFQFAGPLSFQQFFLDTVAEWQTARKKRAHVALNTSKAVTDAILADPARAPLVDVIDQRYWQYLPDGSIFAPDSGGELAFREQRISSFGKDAVPPGTPALVYKQVREYHERFPQKAIICGHAGQGPIPILMAGGAMPLLADYSAAQPLKPERDDRALINFVREHLGNCLAGMEPRNTSGDTWCIADETKGCWLYYSPMGTQLALEQANDFESCSGLWFDPQTGTTKNIQIGEGSTITKPSAGAWFLLVAKR